MRNLLIRTHMYDLITSTENNHYEVFRKNIFTGKGLGEDDVVMKFADQPAKKTIKPKDDEESLRKRFTEQVRLEEARFRKWEQNVSKINNS